MVTPLSESNPLHQRATTPVKIFGHTHDHDETSYHSENTTPEPFFLDILPQSTCEMLDSLPAEKNWREQKGQLKKMRT